ncbi:MAG: hypothetical protein GDA46_06540 [Bdellovibrionales bacterium]|nr:hypothetical protein [Bdellovibrionales bacterium]
MKKTNKTKTSKKWVEIVPYGIIGGMIPSASTMLFKNKKGEERFAVWFSELQSRIAINQNLHKEKVFNFVQKILSSAGITPKYCFFIKREQGRDIVKILFNGKLKPMEFYADEVVSFCMVNQCRFFCSPDFFEHHIGGEIPKRFKNISLLGKAPTYLN